MPLNQLAEHKRRLWLQGKLTCAQTAKMAAKMASEMAETRRWSVKSHKDLRLNCEDSEVLLDSEGFISQLDEEGGGTGAPKPGSRPMELLLPWLLTGGVD